MTQISPEISPELELTDYDSLYCRKHGWLSHVIVHEAAHAAFAAKYGIEFHEVTVLPASEWVAQGTGLRAGGVRPIKNGTLWVPEMPELAMDFAMAGSVAEEHTYTHHLKASYVGDVFFWAAGMGMKVTEENVREVAKELRPLVEASKKRLKAGTLQAILADTEKIARALIAQIETIDGKRYEGLEPLVLTAEEVHRIIQPSVQADAPADSVGPSI